MRRFAREAVFGIVGAIVALDILAVAALVAFAVPRLVATATAPTPAPTLVVVGQGSESRALDLSPGTYRVTWQAQGENRFVASLNGRETTTLVREESASPASGETYAILGGGRYVLDVQSRSPRWSMIFEPVKGREAPPT